MNIVLSYDKAKDNLLTNITAMRGSSLNFYVVRIKPKPNNFALFLSDLYFNLRVFGGTPYIQARNCKTNSGALKIS